MRTKHNGNTAISKGWDLRRGERNLGAFVFENVSQFFSTSVGML